MNRRQLLSAFLRSASGLWVASKTYVFLQDNPLAPLPVYELHWLQRKGVWYAPVSLPCHDATHTRFAIAKYTMWRSLIQPDEAARIDARLRAKAEEFGIAVPDWT
jgi:hypothetical protein